MSFATTMKSRVSELAATALTRAGAHETADVYREEAEALLEARIEQLVVEARGLVSAPVNEMDEKQKRALVYKIVEIFNKVKAMLESKIKMAERAQHSLQAQLKRAVEGAESVIEVNARYAAVGQLVVTTQSRIKALEASVDVFVSQLQERLGVEGVFTQAEGRA